MAKQSRSVRQIRSPPRVQGLGAPRFSLVLSPRRAPEDAKHSQKVQTKGREKKNATAADVSEAIQKAQRQVGNLGDAASTLDK